MQQFYGWARARDVIIPTTGITLGPAISGPYPGTYLTVYLAGTTTPAPIYAVDAVAFFLPNPLLVSADGSFTFWGPEASYDLLFSLTVPATAGAGIFTATEDGLVPASGGGGTNFLRADAVWAVPSGGASVPDASTTVKGIVELATDGESAALLVPQANDSRLSNARTPTAHTHPESEVIDLVDDLGILAAAIAGKAALVHATSHVTGGSDVIASAVAAGNAGLMTGADKTKLDGIASGAEVNVNADWAAGSGDAQILNKPSTFAPSAHAASHLSNGSDPMAAATTTVRGTVELATDGESAASLVPQANDARLSNARTPTAHATSHVTGGSDVMANAVAAGNAGLMTGADKTKLDGIAAGAEVNVNADWTSGAGDSQILNKPSTFAPSAHAASHQNGGADEISVAGLSGLLADGQTPLAHAASHVSGGGDPIALDTLAAPTDVTTLNASTSAHGLMMKYPGGTTNFLRADGSFAAPPGGGSFSATQVTVTLPFPASRRHVVNVIDAAMTATDKILVSLAGVAETQANASDSVDVLALQAVPLAGSFNLQVNSLTPMAGPLVVNYARAA